MAAVKAVPLSLEPVAVSGTGLRLEDLAATKPWQGQGICRVAFKISPACAALARVIIGNNQSTFQTVYGGTEDQLQELLRLGGVDRTPEAVLPRLQVLSPRTQLRSLEQANSGERGNRAKTCGDFSPYVQREELRWALLVVECAPHPDQAKPVAGASFVRAFGTPA